MSQIRIFMMVIVNQMKFTCISSEVHGTDIIIYKTERIEEENKDKKAIKTKSKSIKRKKRQT